MRARDRASPTTWSAPTYIHRCASSSPRRDGCRAGLRQLSVGCRAVVVRCRQLSVRCRLAALVLWRDGRLGRRRLGSADTYLSADYFGSAYFFFSFRRICLAGAARVRGRDRGTVRSLLRNDQRRRALPTFLPGQKVLAYASWDGLLFWGTAVVGRFWSGCRPLSSGCRTVVGRLSSIYCREVEEGPEGMPGHSRNSKQPCLALDPAYHAAGA